MCGGVTVYSPLKENGAGQEGFKRVGISGIGGLGHMGVLFAKALGESRFFTPPLSLPTQLEVLF